MSGPFPTAQMDPSYNPRLEIETYVQQALQLLELNVPPEQLPNVVENFDRMCRIAQPLLDFPLPDNLEAAPQFEP